MANKPKAIFLFSGGLDSLIGVKLLEQQGIKVDLVFFKGYFFNSDLARKSAKANNLKLKTVDFSEEQWALIKKPRHGYGKGMNPCLDCHILMLRMARNMMALKGYDFVATGEVLGQRPMSQTKDRLKVAEKESGLQGFLLRPLSAQMLQITIPEKSGQVDRGQLKSISGRSRKEQLLLAQKFNLKEFPTPAGGCLLTDVEFSKKLKDLMKAEKNILEEDIELLKIGRHYWFDKTKIIIGRDQDENKKLQKKARKGDRLIRLKNIAGPTTLVHVYGSTKRMSNKIIDEAKKLTQKHAPKARSKKSVEFQEIVKK